MSLGCPRNLVDSEVMLGRLSAKGYRIVDIKDAEVALVNTCSFIEEAKKESIDAILDCVELKKGARLKKIIVAGCLTQRYKEELLGHLKEVDAFVGRIELGQENTVSYPLLPGHFAYLKISEGCTHSCSFCVIPRIKGPLKSRRPELILDELKRLDSEGKSEINIIGQDTGTWGLDIYGRPHLAGLLSQMRPFLKNIRWVRLLYLHPQTLTGELLSVMADEPRICKYIDLPLQHIHSRILKAMRRSPGKKDILRLLSDIRRKMPQAAIRTSLIVGFPGETEKEFNELLSFVKEQRFERLGVFRYSREEGSPSFNHPAQVPDKIKDERFDIIMQAQQEISAGLNSKLIGKSLEVMIDEKEDDGNYIGRLSCDAPEVDGSVYVRSREPLKPGAFVKARVLDTYEYDLVAEAS